MSGNGAQRTWRGGVGATSTRMTASPTPAAPVPKTPAATPPQQASTPSPAPIASPLRPASASGLRPLDLQPSEVPVQADHELLHGDPWADALAAGRSSPVRTPSNAKDGSVRKYVDYRLDPASVWGGDQPEKNFKEYQRNLQLWLVEASVSWIAFHWVQSCRHCSRTSLSMRSRLRMGIRSLWVSSKVLMSI